MIGSRTTGQLRRRLLRRLRPPHQLFLPSPHLSSFPSILLPSRPLFIFPSPTAPLTWVPFFVFRRKTANTQWFALNADNKRKTFKAAGEIELRIELRASVEKKRERSSSMSGRRPSYVAQDADSDTESEGEEEEEERKEPTPEDLIKIEEEQVYSHGICSHITGIFSWYLLY